MNARAYLAERKFNDQTLKKFQVGFVPDLSAYATKMRVSLEAMGRPAR